MEKLPPNLELTVEERGIILTLREIQQSKNTAWIKNIETGISTAALTSFIPYSYHYNLRAIANIIAAGSLLPKECQNLRVKQLSEPISVMSGTLAPNWELTTVCSRGKSSASLYFNISDTCQVLIDKRFLNGNGILKFIASMQSSKINTDKMAFRRSLLIKCKEFYQHEESEKMNLIEVLKNFNSHPKIPHVFPYILPEYR